MCEILSIPDLVANIVGGVVAAGVIALIAYLWNRKQHRIMKNLIAIMGKAIEHRNIGEQRAFPNQEEWIQKTKAIEVGAIAIAKTLSPTAGSLLEWLDRVTPWDSTSDVDKYVSILSTMIERIRGLMENPEANPR